MHRLRSRLGGFAAVASVSGIALLGLGSQVANAKSSCAANTKPATACALTGASSTVRSSISSGMVKYYYKIQVKKHQTLTVSVIDNESTLCLKVSNGAQNICGMAFAEISENHKSLGSTMISAPSGHSAGKRESVTVTARVTGTVYIDITGDESLINLPDDNVEYVPTPYVLTVKTR